MQFELEWRERYVGSVSSQTPRRFLDYVVDGSSLYERHGLRFDFISPLGWLSLDEDERAAQRLLQQATADLDGRVALYVCPECADLFCGAITAIIGRDRDEVVWRAMSVSTYDGSEERWEHERIEFRDPRELRFPVTAYNEAIARRPKPLTTLG